MSLETASRWEPGKQKAAWLGIWGTMALTNEAFGNGVGWSLPQPGAQAGNLGFGTPSLPEAAGNPPLYALLPPVLR
jgi:hypothetical protein